MSLNFNKRRYLCDFLFASLGITAPQKGDQLLNEKYFTLGPYSFLKPLKRQTKIAADDTLFFYFYLSKEIRLDISCESSA